jgi:ribosome-binding ATPase
MKVGIVGLARSGKTTIFNALTGSTAAVGAYGSRDANVAVTKVPDERVDRLTEIFKPKKTTFAEFEFVDIAPNAAAGDEKVLDNAALTVLKNTDSLVHVVRAFDDENVMHPLDSVDAARDCQVLEEELMLTDLVVIENRLKRMDKENKKDQESELLERCRDHIEDGKPLRVLELNEQEEKLLIGFTFLSQKPLMLLGNYGDDRIGEDDPAKLQAFADEHGHMLVAFCGTMEMEIAELAEEDRQEFRDDLGLGEASRTAFIQAAYDMLGLMSFLTAGEPEVRAWTIRKNTKAVDAAGTIHSDIQRGFIRAEIVTYDDFMAADGHMAKAKENGKVRLEGKEYLMQDGDMVLFRFNV